MRNIIKQEKPDIIHLHSSKAGFIGRFATNGKRIKMLYNPHGFSFLMQNTSIFQRKIYWIIEKIASFRNCKIVGCSKGEYEEALKLTSNAIRIDNGIDIDRLKEETKDLNKKEINLENLKVCTIRKNWLSKKSRAF